LDLTLGHAARLARQAMIYGLGAMAQAGLSLLLLPLYTRVLPAEAVGAIALLMGLGYAGDVLARAGVNYAFLILAPHEEDGAEREAVTRTAWTLLAIHATAVAVAFVAAAPWLSWLVTGTPEHAGPVRLVAVQVLFSTPVSFMACILRTEGRAASVVRLAVSQLVLGFVASVLLVVVLGRGVQGALEGPALAALVVGSIAAQRLTRAPGLGIHPSHRAALYRLGLATLVAQCMTVGQAYAARWLLQAHATLREVAVFDVAYKTAFVLSLLIGPFSVAWTSGLFEVARGAQPHETFAKLLKYLLAVLCFLALALGLLAPEITAIVGGSAYAAAAPLVAVLASAFVLTGASVFMALGPALAKAAREPLATASAALAASVLLGLLLVPRFGLRGAAWATLGAATVQAAIALRGAQRHYAVAYPWAALATLAALYVACTAAGAWLVGSLVMRVVVLLSFPALLVVAGVLQRDDLALLRRLPAAIATGRTATA
jgi:O-antigen/teichoic acid export membrane protein